MSQLGREVESKAVGENPEKNVREFMDMARTYLSPIFLPVQ